MGKFKTVKEAREAVQEILGSNMTIVCVRYDEREPGTEVISFTPKGIYWIVKFYEDGDIGYASMDWADHLQFV